MEKEAIIEKMKGMSTEQLMALLSARESMESMRKEMDGMRSELEKALAENRLLREALAKKEAALDAKNQTILRDNFNAFVGRSEHSKPGDESPINEAEEISRGAARRGRPEGSHPLGLSEEQLDAMVRPEDVVVIEPEGLDSKAVLIGEDVTYKIARAPASFKVIKIVRAKYDVGGTVAEAPSDDPFPHSPLTPSLAADVCSAKYEMGIPLYRYAGWLRARGFDASAQTLSGWVLRAAELLSPIRDLMADELFRNSQGVINADETTLEVLDSRADGRQKSYIFVYSSSYYAHRVDLYDFSGDRTTSKAAAHLSGFEGILCADGYAGYDSLRSDKIRIQRCWAHVRRRFYDAYKTAPKGMEGGSVAKKVIDAIDGVMRAERSWREAKLTAPEILAKRSEPAYLAKAKGIMALIESIDAAEGSLLDRAVRYAKRMGDELYTYLSDGKADMTNNLAERVVKPFVINRKNFLFSKTERGAEASAVLMTVIRTALGNGLVPERYMEWALSNVGKSDPKDLLPWSDGVPQSCRIAIAK